MHAASPPSRAQLLLRSLVFIVPVVLVVVIFIYVLTPTEANVERRDILANGLVTSALPIPERVVLIREANSRARTGMHDVWHVVYSYSVDARDHTVLGGRDFLSEEAAISESRSGRAIDVKYLAADPDAAVALDNP